MNFIQTAITVLTLATFITLASVDGTRSGNAGNVGGSGAEISQEQTVGTSNNNIFGSGTDGCPGCINAAPGS